MNWFKAFLVYLIAFGTIAFFNIERISLWADEQFKGQHGSPVFRVVRAVKGAYRGSLAEAYSGRLDCLTAGLFKDNYKSGPVCGQDGLPIRETALAASDDPHRLIQPVLKENRILGRDELLAALHLPQTPASDAELGAAAPINGPSPVVQKTAPAPAKPREATLGPAKLEPPHRILVVGDSLAIGLALSLRRAVAAYDAMELLDEGKVSTGLANPKYFNWEEALKTLLDKYNPNIVVVMMGANDAKYIKPNEKPRPPDAKNKSWSQVFSMRVENFLKVLADKNVLTYWVGLPIMGDPAYAEQAQAMNAIVADECEKFANARFLDAWSVLADEDGAYNTFLKNDKGQKIKARANDKIHFTVAGSDLLADFFFKAAAPDVDLKLKTIPETAAKDADAATGEQPQTRQ